MGSQPNYIESLLVKQLLLILVTVVVDFVVIVVDFVVVVVYILVVVVNVVVMSLINVTDRTIFSCSQ